MATGSDESCWVFKPTLCMLAVSMALAGCATTGTGQAGGTQPWGSDLVHGNTDPCSNFYKELATIGGGVVGALIGAKLGNKKAGAVVAGALVGGVLGNLIGESIDRRRCELVKVANNYKLDMQFQPIAANGTAVEAKIGEAPKDAIGLSVSVRDAGGSSGHFESNSDRLTPKAREYFAEIAAAYNDEAALKSNRLSNPEALKAAQNVRRLLLVGHTDDTGSSRLNADLSERRAQAVARYMKERGVAENVLFYQGAGETMPIADNRTEEGRAKNRRVEIIELNDDAALQKYLASRTPKYEFYRPESVVLAKSSDKKPAHSSGSTKSKSASVSGAAVEKKPGTPSGATGTASVASAGATTSSESQVSGQSGAPKLSPAPTAQITASVSGAPKLGTAPGAKARVETGPVVAVTGNAVDFGGTPLAHRTQVNKLGSVIHEEGLFAIKSAYADDAAALASCNRDRPRESGTVKALKDGKPYRTSETYPGLYGKSWSDLVNGHLVVVNNVAVLRDGAAPAAAPTVRIYRDYDPKINRNPKPDVDVVAAVNTYKGTDGLLYRVFGNGAGGLSCMDIVFPVKGGQVAKGGEIVYVKAGENYGADFLPKFGQ